MLTARSRFVPVLAAAILLISISAGATTRIQRSFSLRYPEVTGTRLANCVTCHASKPPALNPYGLDLRREKLGFAAIERLDSDRDGFRNGDEIRALSFPGDSTDRPAEETAPGAADSSRSSAGEARRGR